MPTNLCHFFSDQLKETEENILFMIKGLMILDGFVMSIQPGFVLPFV